MPLSFILTFKLFIDDSGKPNSLREICMKISHSVNSVVCDSVFSSWSFAKYLANTRLNSSWVRISPKILIHDRTVERKSTEIALFEKKIIVFIFPFFPFFFIIFNKSWTMSVNRKFKLKMM